MDEKMKSKKNEHSILLSKVVQYIVDTQLRSNNRRSINPVGLSKVRKYFDSLKTDKKEPKPALRMQAEGRILKDEHAQLVEKELKIALTHKKSALFDRPYVEKLGKNDYLVLRPEVVDPFVTVVPNHMYYNIEKSCVNWLDDCSLSGLRQRLLRGSQSFKK